MLHYTLVHHSSSVRLISDTSLYREEGRTVHTKKKWRHITNQNNGIGYSKNRHTDVAVTTSMIGQKVSRRIRWGYFTYRHISILWIFPTRICWLFSRMTLSFTSVEYSFVAMIYQIIVSLYWEINLSYFVDQWWNFMCNFFFSSSRKGKNILTHTCATLGFFLCTVI